MPLWSLTEDTLVEVSDDGRLVVVTRQAEFEIGEAAPVVVESLRRMALGPISLSNVTSPARRPAATDPPESPVLTRVLDRLSGSVVRSLGLRDGRGPLLSVLPVGLAPPLAPRPVPDHVPVRLSRFAVLRPVGGLLVLECPRSHFRVQLARSAATRVAAVLSTPASITDLAGRTGVARHVVADVVAYLAAAGVVLVGDGGARFDEDTDPELTRWEPHELLFHVHSRARPSNGPAERSEPGEPPLLRRPPAGSRTGLPVPALGDLPADEPSLAALLESDHRCPPFTGAPVTAALLGELLYRSARVRSVGTASPVAGPGRLATQRPYLSIANLYELELYVTANDCTGVPRAVHHYDPAEHVLTLVNDDPADVAALLDMAMVAGAGQRRPAAVITVTVRMERVSHVLGPAAYAAALLHLGAFQQTLYLTAKAMGLSAHPVPADASDRVDRALRLSWPAEVSIGECVLDAGS
ncbi:SagB/ThcOx family dehydrogenase [Amycolatopsis suaedae]|uniref:SagB/ThcOx family dehydrogenase n=2 Tax=Amycolatopsis suaedae TaxID=2510978 RepID=A0A4Q7J1M8_9PSEU|nr:SagB/ThcOx family dehydrogenase [Amycolatopsis suaedae]